MIFNNNKFIPAIICVTVVVTTGSAIDWSSFDFSAKYDEPPIAIITVQPEFPDDVIISSEEELLLAILVDVEGKVGDVVLLEEGVTPGVTDAVIAAVLQNRYEPAKYHGAPVEVWYMISVPVTRPHKDTEPDVNPGSIVPKGLEKK